MSSFAALRQVDPNNPKGYYIGGTAIALFGAVLAQREHAVEQLLRAAQLGQQQRGDVLALFGSSAAVPCISARDMAAVSPAVLESALTSYEQARPALQRIRHLLPNAWVLRCESAVEPAETLLPSLRSQLKFARTANAAEAGGPAALAAAEAVSSARVEAL